MAFIDHRSQATRRPTEAVVKHMQRFNLDPSSRPGSGISHPAVDDSMTAIPPALDIPARLDIEARLKPDGLAGLESRYPNEINEDNLQIWKDFVRDLGIRLVTTVPLLFDPRMYAPTQKSSCCCLNWAGEWLKV